MALAQYSSLPPATKACVENLHSKGQKTSVQASTLLLQAAEYTVLTQYNKRHTQKTQTLGQTARTRAAF